LCNKPGAGVLELAKQYSIPGLIKTNWESDNGEALLEELKSRRIDYLVLAGFLKKIPLRLIENFPRRIINIHPALLPRFGGKGMYGANVHRAVIESGEKESGITIHFVDEHYDTGDVIFQARCRVEDSDSAESLAEKIHLLEHKHFPDVVESVILSQNPG
jgi:phosphoribosylglycinamide formyltransferase-1